MKKEEKEKKGRCGNCAQDKVLVGKNDENLPENYCPFCAQLTQKAREMSAM